MNVCCMFACMHACVHVHACIPYSICIFTDNRPYMYVSIVHQSRGNGYILMSFCMALANLNVSFLLYKCV